MAKSKKKQPTLVNLVPTQPLPRGSVVLVDWGQFPNRESVLAHIQNVMTRRHPFLRTNDGEEIALINNADAEFFEECIVRYTTGVQTRRKEHRC